jgi:DNA-binding CsgD family transcriptional regulator
VSFLKKAKKEGADSFIYKNTSLEETKQVIVSTYRGYSIFPSEKISDENRFLVESVPKEMEVLRYVCQGYDRKEIAEAMFNSENTIKSYIRSILNKTGYDSIAKLAIYAVSHGFVLPERGGTPPRGPSCHRSVSVNGPSGAKRPHYFEDRGSHSLHPENCPSSQRL